MQEDRFAETYVATLQEDQREDIYKQEACLLVACYSSREYCLVQKFSAL
jgi:hypothetical protein